jgi:hypothetical protein
LSFRFLANIPSPSTGLRDKQPTVWSSVLVPFGILNLDTDKLSIYFGSSIALVLGMMLVRLGQRASIDWHLHRGLSFLQLGLRQLHSLLSQQKPLPLLEILPKSNPQPSSCLRFYCQMRKVEKLDFRIEFSRVSTVSE